MTKTELEALIHGVAATLVYGVYLSEFAEKSGGETAMIEQMKTVGYMFKAPSGGTDEALAPNQLHEMFGERGHLPIIKRNLDALLSYSLVRLCYEATVLYCKRGQRLALMQDESWYPYTRVVRNVVSHADHSELVEWPATWRDTPKNRANGTWRQTAAWRHRSSSETDVGKAVPFTLYDAWKLHLDMLDFVQKRLP